MAKNDRTMNRSHVSGRPGVRSRSEQCKPESLTPSQTGGTRLQFPPGEADLEALRSVTREWLVPSLVDKFLRDHGVELKHVRSVPNRLQPSLSDVAPLVSASRISEETESQVKKKTNTGTLSKGGHGKEIPCS
jgi:hypothetical protein